jgi:Prp8 binding protein
MLIATDLKTGERLARYPAHYGPLNSLAVTISGGRELVLTGGDDGVARVFDIGLEGKDPVVEFDDGRDCPVTAVTWSADGNQCFVGGVDNEVKVGEALLAWWTLFGREDIFRSVRPKSWSEMSKGRIADG